MCDDQDTKKDTVGKDALEKEVSLGQLRSGRNGRGSGRNNDFQEVSRWHCTEEERREREVALGVVAYVALEGLVWDGLAWLGMGEGNGVAWRGVEWKGGM
ncbi:hypothetical protein E2C01_082153 [Portunus trituberculatus]|uniref:Uncharacterized protein n=1 Tax=Portunus trituberculatus TaxID=210409 RepID=A0A5B7IXP8_PORTR|nr:hypothetical protein [Portunus trituberculatus]